MPMCGFNEKMLNGLGMFYKGLIDITIKKSKEKNITMEEVIDDELKEMDKFLEELKR